MNNNLFETIVNHIKDMEKVFLETATGRVFTYSDMINLSGQYANALKRIGIKKGDRVAVQVDKSPQVLFLYLACLRAGAVYLPLNTDYTSKEVSYFLEDAKPVLAICKPSSLVAFETITENAGVKFVATLSGNNKGSFVDLVQHEKTTFETARVEGDDLAAILYTSGTTGRSKGAMLSHENLRSNALSLVDYWHFTSEDILLHPLPVYHTHGLFVATNTVLLSGSSMIFQTKFDVLELIKLMPKATTMMGVPTHYLRLLSTKGFTKKAAEKMRLFISGSAPLSPETHKAFFALTGHQILERYGMTETNMNTSNPYEGKRIPGTVGLPLPNIDVRITNPETGMPLKQGEVGVIEVRGPNVFKGYWEMPEKTAAEFRDDGFFITGDLGVIDKNGYVSIVGREKDLIITGGLNVYPAEIEAVLDGISGVIESAVIGLPHSDFGEAVTAIVAGKETQSFNEESIRLELAENLANFKVPKKVIFVESLMRNSMGKIQKKVMREKYSGLYND